MSTISSAMHEPLQVRGLVELYRTTLERRGYRQAPAFIFTVRGARIGRFPSGPPQQCRSGVGWHESIRGPVNHCSLRRAAVALHAPQITERFRRAVRTAAAKCASLAERKISPHTIRHTTAMHLLQSGVDITLIALWLGHESPATTHIYVEADLKMKEAALKLLTPPALKQVRYRPHPTGCLDSCKDCRKLCAARHSSEAAGSVFNSGGLHIIIDRT